MQPLVGEEYLALPAHDDGFGFYKLSRRDRPLRVNRTPLSLIRLPGDERDRTGRDIDLCDETAEAVRAENNVALQIGRHPADLIRKDKFSVGCLQRRDHSAWADLTDDAVGSAIVLLVFLRLLAQSEIVRYEVRADGVFYLVIAVGDIDVVFTIDRHQADGIEAGTRQRSVLELVAILLPGELSHRDDVIVRHDDLEDNVTVIRVEIVF